MVVVVGGTVVATVVEVVVVGGRAVVVVVADSAGWVHAVSATASRVTAARARCAPDPR